MIGDRLTTTTTTTTVFEGFSRNPVFHLLDNAKRQTHKKGEKVMYEIIFIVACCRVDAIQIGRRQQDRCQTHSCTQAECGSGPERGRATGKWPGSPDSAPEPSLR